jgi:hypothetical protein
VLSKFVQIDTTTRKNVTVSSVIRHAGNEKNDDSGLTKVTHSFVYTQSSNLFYLPCLRLGSVFSKMRMNYRCCENRYGRPQQKITVHWNYGRRTSRATIKNRNDGSFVSLHQWVPIDDYPYINNNSARPVQE